MGSSIDKAQNPHCDFDHITVYQIGTELVEGAASACIDYGWQTNGVGNKYSNSYGFGLADVTCPPGLDPNRCRVWVNVGNPSVG